MKITSLIISLLIILNFAFAEKVIVLPDLVNPNSIIIDNDNMYITEGTSVYIYSLKDFKLLKKFGGKGQGPGEFITLPGIDMRLYILNNHLFINSISKISIFTKKGIFVKEIRTKKRDADFQPMDKIFVGSSVIMKDKVQYQIINIYNANLKKIKEIFRQKTPFQPDNLITGFNPLIQFQSTSQFYSMCNRIFIKDNNGIIHVFKATGKEIFLIKHNFEKLKVTNNHKEEVYNYYKNHPGTKMIFKAIKNKMKFPTYFPYIRNYKVNDNRIYVLPYAKKNGISCFYIFNMKGKLVEKIPVKIEEKNILELYPFFIKGRKLFQLVENEEEWELHIKSI
jgi:hypothetical protein